MSEPFIQLLNPNRTRRNYRGGALLDTMEGVMHPGDGNRPEDWIASTVEARNPGLEPIPGEGLSKVSFEGSETSFLRDVFARHPEHYLGRTHYEACGPQLGFLTKLLDSSMRLHVQAHPTAAFAREHMGSPYGKLETYVVMGHRAGVEPYIRLGFQHPPSPEEWKRIVMDQDIKAMDACFDRIPVQVGEVWMVPGGLPHAIGEGLLVLETMEPSDLVVRCEFEREGIVVPPDARFMGRDPDFAMRIFDYTPMPLETLYRRCRIQPSTMEEGPGYLREEIIGPAQTLCFRQERLRINESATFSMNNKAAIGVVVQGEGKASHGNERLALRRGSRLLIAAAAGSVSFVSSTTEPPLEVIICTR